MRESTLGRAAWIGLLVVLCAYVTVDLARSPFPGSTGSASLRRAQLTLWVPGPEAGGTGMVVARQAAAGLELLGLPTVVKRLPGGSSQGVGAFLGRRSRRGHGELLVVTSSTLADLAHDRDDKLVPGAAQVALVARQLLVRSVPLAMLSADPLLLGVGRGAGITESPALLAVLRRQPGRRLVAIGSDSFSRVQLAALLKRAGVAGHVRFDIRESAPVAVEAVQSGGAGSVLSPRSAVLEELRGGLLRGLRWPLDGGRAPRAWVALVASPRLGAAKIARLRRWAGELSGDRRWRASQRRQGRTAPDLSRGSLAPLLRAGLRRADREERLSKRVEGGG